MQYSKSYILKRISHANKRVDLIKESHGENPSKTHTYFGGYDLGYWQGMLTAYQNVLDEFAEINIFKEENCMDKNYEEVNKELINKLNSLPKEEKK